MLPWTTKRGSSALVEATRTELLQQRLDDLMERTAEGCEEAAPRVAPVVQGIYWVSVAAVSLLAMSLVPRVVLGTVMLVGGFLVVVLP